MPFNRPFKDAQGKRGQPGTVSKSVCRTNDGKLIRFTPLDQTHITVEYPLSFGIKTVKVHKADGLRLAYWLLDNCSMKLVPKKEKRSQMKDAPLS